MASEAVATTRRTARWGGELTTLRGAAADFLKRESPWLIVGAATAAGIGRAVLGEFGWADLVAVAGMLWIYPFGEWAIHVYLLHMKPFRFRGRRIDTLAARAHRTHHGTPNDLDQLLLYSWQVAGLLVAVALVAGTGGVLAWVLAGLDSWPSILSAVFTGFVLVGLYEWTHFLIHTGYRPRTFLYRAVWRNHRLHHFKNEHFWHGVTNNFSDWVLGTKPDHREVERSETTRTLDPGPL